MATISIKNFVDALANAPAFKPPELDIGVQYIQDKICNRLKNGVAVAFSEIDFSAFNASDFDTLSDVEYREHCHNEKVTAVVSSLHKIKPVVLSGTFI